MPTTISDMSTAAGAGASTAWWLRAIVLIGGTAVFFALYYASMESWNLVKGTTSLPLQSLVVWTVRAFFACALASWYARTWRGCSLALAAESLVGSARFLLPVFLLLAVFQFETQFLMPRVAAYARSAGAEYAREQATASRICTTQHLRLVNVSTRYHGFDGGTPVARCADSTGVLSDFEFVY